MLALVNLFYIVWNSMVLVENVSLYTDPIAIFIHKQQTRTLIY